MWESQTCHMLVDLYAACFQASCSCQICVAKNGKQHCHIWVWSWLLGCLLGCPATFTRGSCQLSLPLVAAIIHISSRCSCRFASQRAQDCVLFLDSLRLQVVLLAGNVSAAQLTLGSVHVKHECNQGDCPLNVQAAFRYLDPDLLLPITSEYGRQSTLMMYICGVSSDMLHWLSACTHCTVYCWWSWTFSNPATEIISSKSCGVCDAYETNKPLSLIACNALQLCKRSTRKLWCLQQA